MTPPVELRRTEAPAIGADTVLVVPEALLPLLCWREVPVVREVREGLTQLERLLLEMAVALGTVDSEDFEQVVSLPRSVLAGGMSRLVAGGAVSLIGEEFHVISEVAARFLQQEVVIRQMESTADFALLPRSGDLLTVSADKGRSWLRELEVKRLLHATNAPVPRELWDQRVSAYLSKRLREGTIAGPEADVRAVREPKEDPPLLGTAGSSKGNGRDAARKGAGVCPAYRCHAEVRRSPAGEYSVHAVVRGETRRAGDADQQEEEAAQLEVDFTGAVGLVKSWLELASALDDPTTLRAAWREIGPSLDVLREEPRARRRSPAEWEFLLSGAAAHAIAEQGRALAQPVGLAIKGEEATVELLCRFAPADEDAQALFARDTAAISLLGSGDPSDELDAACHQAGTALVAPTPHLSPEAVRERIWQLGWHRLAYALREREDFPHD